MGIGSLTDMTQQILNHVNRQLFAATNPEKRDDGDFLKTLASVQGSLQASTREDGSGKTLSHYLNNPIPALPIQRETIPIQSTGETTTSANPQIQSPAAISSELKTSKREKNTAERARIETAIAQAADQYDVPPSLIRAVIQAESSFRTKVVSKAGAKGLMQLMPATAKELGVKDAFNIEQNITGGTKYLRRMLDLFGGDAKTALAAYNAGPGTIIRNGGKIPYRETLAYVDRVMSYKSQYEVA